EQEAGLAEFGLDAAWTTEEVDAIVASVTPPSEEDWADAFEQSGDTEHVDRVKQVTFVLDEQDHADLMAHLRNYDGNKNTAIVQWLRESVPPALHGEEIEDPEAA